MSDRKPRLWRMDVEFDRVQPHPRGGMIGTAENPEYTDLPPGTLVRRYVTEWEAVDE